MPRVPLSSLLAVLLLTSGCGGEESAPTERAADEPRATTQATTRATASGQPTAPSRSPSATTAPPTAQSTPESTEPSSPAGKAKDRDRKLPPPARAARTDASYDHLLPVGTLPRFGGQAWTVRATGPERSEPVGACQKTPLVDIGAVSAVRREFVAAAAGGATAHQVVARFADPKSAWRAHQVLRSWRDDCAERLDRPATDVGPMRDVDLAPGTGGHYRSTHGTRRNPDAAGLGIVRVGQWLSVVELSAAPADYPSSWEPARRAVRRIAATFA